MKLFEFNSIRELSFGDYFYISAESKEECIKLLRKYIKYHYYFERSHKKNIEKLVDDFISEYKMSECTGISVNESRGNKYIEYLNHPSNNIDINSLKE